MPSTLATVASSAADLAGAVHDLAGLVPDFVTAAGLGAGATALAMAGALGGRRSLEIKAARGPRGISVSAKLEAPVVTTSREVMPGARVLIDPDGLAVPLADLHKAEVDYMLRRAGAILIDDRRIQAWALPGVCPTPAALSTVSRHLRRRGADRVALEIRAAGWWTAAAPARDAVGLLYRAVDVLPHIPAGWRAEQIGDEASGPVDMPRSSLLAADDDGGLVYRHIGEHPRAVLGPRWAATALGQAEAGAPDPEFSAAACAAYRDVLETGRPRVDVARATVRRDDTSDPILISYRRIIRRIRLSTGRLGLAVTTQQEPRLALA